PEPHGVALAAAHLLDVDDLALRVELDLAEDLLARPVPRMALDEDELAARPELRRLLDDPLDHAGLVARRHDHRGAELAPPGGGVRPRDDPVRQAELPEAPQVRQDAVEERRD